MYKCNNCDHVAQRDDMNYVRDLSERFEVGDIYTDRECTQCGALAHPLDDPEKPSELPHYPLIWTDQPAVLETAEPLLTLNIESNMVQIRKAADRYYVTHGNLFGSQTMQMATSGLVFRVLELAIKSRNRKASVKMPEGVESVAE